MIKIDYTQVYYLEESEPLSDELTNLLKNKCSYILDDLLNSKYKVSTVKSPFILADNNFDIEEANNTLEEINIKRVTLGSFTGGAIYIIYEKIGDIDNYIIHGNNEEGYNIFNLI